MTNWVQPIFPTRQDWEPLLRKAAKTINEVMEAGELQRIKHNKDPHGWQRADVLDRLNHVLHHILIVHHKQNVGALTEDTYLEHIKHALVGILIILVNDDKEPEQLIEAVEE
jgi:hypothetical protein